MTSIRATIGGLRRPLLGLSLPLLLIGGAVVAADRGGPAADVTVAEAAAGARGGDAGDGRSGPKTTRAPESTTVTTTPPTTATTAPPTTAAPRPAAPAPTAPPAPPATQPEPPAPPATQPPAPPVTEPPAPAVVPPPAGGEIAPLVQHHNAVRAAAGLPPLSYNGCLANLAQLYSNQLATVLLELIHQANLGGLIGSCLTNWRTAGENIGFSGTGADIAEAFFDSPRHRDNILRAEFSQIGVGAVRSPDGRLWVTVLFAG